MLASDLPRARRAYASQKCSARCRRVTFTMSFDEWCAFWAIEDRWNRRGRGGDRLVMARHGDVGAYTIENVFVCTFVENNRSARPQYWLPFPAQQLAFAL